EAEVDSPWPRGGKRRRGQALLQRAVEPLFASRIAYRPHAQNPALRPIAHDRQWIEAFDRLEVAGLVANFQAEKHAIRDTAVGSPIIATGILQSRGQRGPGSGRRIAVSQRDRSSGQ